MLCEFLEIRLALAASFDNFKGLWETGGDMLKLPEIADIRA